MSLIRQVSREHPVSQPDEAEALRAEVHKMILQLLLPAV